MDNTNFAKYISEIDMKIQRTMKQYNLTQEDVSIGNAAQIKGYVMGLKDAVNEAKKMFEESSHMEVETTSDGYVMTQRRSRSRRTRNESDE